MCLGLQLLELRAGSIVLVDVLSSKVVLPAMAC